MRRSRRHPRPDQEDGSRRSAEPAPAGSAPDGDANPADGERNQGGARPEGIDYQRDLGSEQDA